MTKRKSRIMTKTRTAIEPMQKGTLYQRALQIGDARLGSEVGRLHFAGKMPATEAAAAARVAEIYGAYERVAGVKRSCRSPSYEVGHGGGGETTESDGDERAATAWHGLQEQIPRSPMKLRDWLEHLVVEDRHIGAEELAEVRALLKDLARYFGSGARKAGPKRRGADPKHVPPTKFQSSTIERDALHATLLKVDPTLSQDQLLEWTTFFFACQVRKRYEAEKAVSKR